MLSLLGFDTLKWLAAETAWLGDTEKLCAAIVGLAWLMVAALN